MKVKLLPNINMLSGIPLSFMPWIITYVTLHVPAMLVLSISSNIAMERL